MTETPERATSQTPAARPYQGWQLSDEARQEERLFDDRADARERWEKERTLLMNPW